MLLSRAIIDPNPEMQNHNISLMEFESNCQISRVSPLGQAENMTSRKLPIWKILVSLQMTHTLEITTSIITD